MDMAKEFPALEILVRSKHLNNSLKNIGALTAQEKSC